MRRIERTNAFRRDFKREKRGQFGRELEAVLTSVITLLAENEPLPERNRDHALGGDWDDPSRMPSQVQFAADLPEAGRGGAATHQDGFARRAFWLTVSYSRSFSLPGLK